jgi:hypothetical protein
MDDRNIPDRNERETAGRDDEHAVEQDVEEEGGDEEEQEGEEDDVAGKGKSELTPYLVLSEKERTKRASRWMKGLLQQVGS